VWQPEFGQSLVLWLRKRSMTGYTVHTGSTEAFSEGFDRIFGKGTGKGAAAAAGAKKATKKKAAKKSPGAAKKTKKGKK